MKIPGPDHPLRIEPARRRWRVLFEGHVIADGDDALVVQKANFPAWVYFRREDVGMEYLAHTAQPKHCEYKGDAVQFTLLMDGHFEVNVAKSYENPYPAAQALSGRVAFDPDRVEVYEVDDAVVNPRPTEPRSVASRDVDEVVQHTDTGDGHAQRDHWPPNTQNPEGGVR
jgi:uncharacterized protein (DUF427 family)